MNSLLNGREIMRLFTCVWVPNDIREKIKLVQGKMVNLPMKVKFVEINNLHFTVSFLGEMGSSDLPNLKSKLDEVVKENEKFNVKIEGLKTIPSENYIRVIGIKVKDTDKIGNLIKSVGDKIGGKFYLEQKITLCRVKKILDKEVVQNFIRSNKNIKIGEFQVNRVSLVKSTLTKSGPIYETIHDSYLE